MGCGVAFIDYDNDGWLDIFVLSGTPVENPPAGAHNRLYKNNRNGTFTDVTEQAGLKRSGWASSVSVGDYDNDGFDDLFVTYWGQNVLYRNNGDGTFTRCHCEGRAAAAGNALGIGLHVPGLRPRWPPGPVCGALPGIRFCDRSQAGRELQLQLERHSGELRPARSAARFAGALPQQRRRYLHQCERAVRRAKAERRTR